MILFIEPYGGDRSWFKVTDHQDLAPIFMQYPMTEDIAHNCTTLQEALQAIAEYLDGHNQRSWVEEEHISKSLRNKAIALGMSLAAAVPSVQKLPQPKISPLHNTPVQVQEEAKPKYDFGSHPHDHFLWNIKQLETSGGQNLNHSPIKSGKFKGQRAIGKWGLLQPTIKELTNRMRLRGDDTTQYDHLANMSRDQLAQHFQENPQIELNLARELATHVLKRQGGNENRAAYAWLHGHNLHPADIGKDKTDASSYVSKYNAVSQLNPFKPKKTSVALEKVQQEIDSEDFRMRVKNWYKRREDEVTAEPMRSSNFTPDPGRLRDDKLDDVKPDSMRTPMERVANNVKNVNENK